MLNISVCVCLQRGLNHGLSQSCGRTGVTEALTCKQPVSGYSVHVCILNHVSTVMGEDRLTLQGHISRTLCRLKQLAVFPRWMLSHRLSRIIQCSYSFSIFCTFLLWLLGLFFKANLHSRYRLLHKSDMVIEQCFIILSDFFFYWFAVQRIYSKFTLSNISFKHSSSQIHRLKSDMDSTLDFCYFWYCCIFNNALVLHSLLWLLCFFQC